jgi:hypothetical protein
MQEIQIEEKIQIDVNRLIRLLKEKTNEDLTEEEAFSLWNQVSKNTSKTVDKNIEWIPLPEKDEEVLEIITIWNEPQDIKINKNELRTFVFKQKTYKKLDKKDIIDDKEFNKTVSIQQKNYLMKTYEEQLKELEFSLIWAKKEYETYLNTFSLDTSKRVAAENAVIAIEKDIINCKNKLTNLNVLH